MYMYVQYTSSCLYYMYIILNLQKAKLYIYTYKELW